METLAFAFIFAPLSWLYRLGQWLDSRLQKKHRLPYAVTSVGNIAMGGRAKTPFVIHLCRRLKEAGYFPVVLTRGYGRVSTADVTWQKGSDSNPLLMGDEACEISHSGFAEAIIVGAKRAKLAEKFLHEQKKILPWVFVLDDGFQHWSLERDFDIVLVAAEDLNGHVVPWGRLREPSKNLSRANLVLEIGKDLTKETHLPEMPKSAGSLVLTTRATDSAYRMKMKQWFRDAKFTSLKDHASPDKMISALAKTPLSEIILGDKEAVKIFSESEFRTWKTTHSISKKIAGSQKTFYRAQLTLHWNNEHAHMQQVISAIEAKMASHEASK